MGATGIEWTKGPNGEQGYSFNPWVGCTKVSGACDHCYAEGAAVKLDVAWGPHAPRRPVSESTWAGPPAWNRKAEREGVRFRVFCASMADVFDNHRSIDFAWRERLFRLMMDTPNLDWLILTKRPQNARNGMLPISWAANWPNNVWFGITGENQEEFDRRWLWTCDLPAPVLFISAEPMLGEIDIRWTLDPIEVAGRILRSGRFSPGFETIRRPGWFIAGGESGTLANCRDTDDGLFIKLLAQCHFNGIPYFQKQLAQIRHRADYKKFERFPEVLQVRQQPTPRIAA